MASSSRLAVWSCLLLAASSAVSALSVPQIKARDGHYDDDWSDDYDGDAYSSAHPTPTEHKYPQRIHPTKAPNLNPVYYDVQVGPDGRLEYDPPYVHANYGDIVRFHFNPKNHTVTQSSFWEPCTPQKGLFDTGFVPVTPETHPRPVKEFTVTENSGAPFFFHCQQVNHCASGMVFVINPSKHGEQTFEKFQEKAKHTAMSATQAPPASTAQPWEHAATPPANHHKPATHNVQVGPHGRLVYEPHNVHAKVGDIIRFHFNPKNHTVTQSSFEHPCNGIDGGFKTGFIPVAPDTKDLPYRDFHVPESHGKPLWFYCGQVNHCQSGMVFSINAPHAPSANSFDAFKAKAIESGQKTDMDEYDDEEGDGEVDNTDLDSWEHKKNDHKNWNDDHKKTWNNDWHKPKPHDVQVGPHGKLVYEPPYIHAKPGDIVRFHFNPKNHTVTQSAFDAPCTPLADGWGFRTGFVPVAPGAHPITKEFTVPDNHGKPLWFYCGQVNHCSSGMVFAINPPAPPSHNTFDAFKHNAMATANMHKPSGNKPSGNWDLDANDDNNDDDDRFVVQAAAGAGSAISSESTQTLRTYAVAGLALLGLNALLAIAAVVVGVMIYVKKNGSTKVTTIGAGRPAYVPVFDADKS